MRHLESIVGKARNRPKSGYGGIGITSDVHPLFAAVVDEYED